jgi:hypothetical protein
MVVEAKRKEELKPKVDVSKIVKTSFDFTIEEVLPVEEPVETKKEVKTVVSYVSSSYYNKLAELDEELSNSFSMTRGFEPLTRKELLILIDKAVTKEPELYYDHTKLGEVLHNDYFVSLFEGPRDIQEYLDIINQRDVELMEG